MLLLKRVHFLAIYVYLYSQKNITAVETWTTDQMQVCGAQTKKLDCKKNLRLSREYIMTHRLASRFSHLLCKCERVVTTTVWDILAAITVDIMSCSHILISYLIKERIFKMVAVILPSLWCFFPIWDKSHAKSSKPRCNSWLETILILSGCPPKSYKCRLIY